VYVIDNFMYLNALACMCAYMELVLVCQNT
jgi:hypothetical protein